MPTPQSLRIADEEAPSERRSRILDAAERCFVRAGFHRTTMQDIAAEARMSAGNLYRYFPSKDSMVVGLAERDRADMGRDFSVLAGAENLAASFATLARKHFSEEPREKAVLCLEIWAEATRNPVFAEITKGFETDIIGRMTVLFEQAREQGSVDASVDPRSLAVLVATVADGLFVRRAVVQDFDAPREVANLVAIIEAAMAGRIHLAPPAPVAPRSASAGAGACDAVSA